MSSLVFRLSKTDPINLIVPPSTDHPFSTTLPSSPTVNLQSLPDPDWTSYHPRTREEAPRSFETSWVRTQTALADFGDSPESKTETRPTKLHGCTNSIKHDLQVTNHLTARARSFHRAPSADRSENEANATSPPS